MHLLRLLRTAATRNRGLVIYKPTTVNIHRSAEIRIAGKLEVNRQWNLNVSNKNAGYLSIGEDAQLVVNGYFIAYYGCTIGVAKGATLKLGDSGYLNADSKIRCYKEITIGDGTIISENVSIRDSDDHSILDGKHKPTQPIHIGKRVWIGMGAMILKGVTIGDGAIADVDFLIASDF